MSVVSAERAKRLLLTAIRTRMRFVERVLRASLYLSPLRKLERPTRGRALVGRGAEVLEDSIRERRGI